MKHCHGKKPFPRKGGTGFSNSRLRFIPTILLGMLFLGTGCANKQQPDYNGAAAKHPATVQNATTGNAGNNTDGVVEAARKNIGIPYKFGGIRPETGFDCSGLVCWSFSQVGVEVPRTAKGQLGFGQRVAKESLEPGDIVVFKGTRSRTGWHSGIYTGEGKFIHSPTRGKKVIESSMTDKYFAKRFAGASRVALREKSAALVASH